MAAYAFETETGLVAQLTANNIDSITATQIKDFLDAAGKFQDNSSHGAPTSDPTVYVYGPTTLTGSDSTPGVDVYEVNAPDFNTNGWSTLPGATAIVDTNNGPDTINIFNNVSSNFLLAAGDGGNFINLHEVTGNDTILAGNGNNYILAGNGHETIYTGSGSDTVGIAGGNNVVYDDTSAAASGSTNIIQVDNSTVPGGDNNNQIYGGSGTDYFNIFGGTNTVVGGTGVSVFNVTTANAQTLEGGSGYNLYDIGTAGGSAADTITGGTGYNEVNINATSGSVSIDGSSNPNGNSVDFTQFASSDASITTDPSGAKTYSFDGGALKVSISNPADTTIKFGH